MDAFFASIEQRDNPDYRGKPISVGGTGDRGVVAAASYEARKYGVRSAMPIKTALRKCPHLILVRPRFEVYKKVSNQIREIFSEYSDLVEPLSIDEAYLDVTYHKKGKPSATLIALEIKKRIKEVTGLTASAGVSFNKFLAKIASDYNKPDGLFVITPDEADAFIDNLEIEKFFGVGKVTAGKFKNMGIYWGRDLKKLSLSDLVRDFGKAGQYYYNVVRGKDDRPVNPHHERKSIGAERTFSHDLFDSGEMKAEVVKVADILWERIIKTKKKGKTITVKVKFANFEQITRSHTLDSCFETKEQLMVETLRLLPFRELTYRGIRLIGITVSNFSGDEKGMAIQLTIDF